MQVIFFFLILYFYGLFKKVNCIHCIIIGVIRITIYTHWFVFLIIFIIIAN
jgi:hypothetical protein